MRVRDILVLFCLAAALTAFSACSDDDDKKTDGDAEESLDGDSGEQEEEAAPADGDDEILEAESEGDDDQSAGACIPEVDTLCMHVDAPSMAQPDPYVKHQTWPSGCKKTESKYTVYFYENATSETKVELEINVYQGAGTYERPAGTTTDLTLRWSINATPDVINYYGINPCTVIVDTDELQGRFDCTLQDYDNPDKNFNARGAWNCSEFRQ